MKLLDGFENDLNLRDVGSIKSLFKVMLANGVKSVDADDFIVCVSVYGLIENVPQELWTVKDNNACGTFIVANQNGIQVSCYVSNKEAFSKRTGFKFPEVEE